VKNIKLFKRNNQYYLTNMETTVFYVAIAYDDGIFNPTVVEKFDNKADADSYAALMCRSKQRRYIVLKQVTQWDSISRKNA
jgi:hypothetical protein